MKAIEIMITNSDLVFKLEDDLGDHLFYLTSRTGKQFTFDICNGYVAFYGNRKYDLINYVDSDYINQTLNLIKR